MRNETLLKVVIAFFAILLIVMGTFAYGNLQRQKQKESAKQDKQSNTTEQHANQDKPVESKPQTPSPSQQQQTQNAQNIQPAQSTTKPAPKPSPVASAAPSKAAIPATGSEGLAVIPMTLLSVLGYLYWQVKKKPTLLISKSKRS